MTEQEKKEKEIYLDALRERYKQAAGAMRKGVVILHEGSPANSDTNPKSLRIGVNSAMVECRAVMKILMAKGIITEEEWMAALAESMEAEVERYNQVISQRRGYRVNLLRGDGV